MVRRTMRRQLVMGAVTLALAVAAGACGGRAVPGDAAVSPGDADGGGPGDGPRAGDGPPLPRDQLVRDSCLPIPAKQVTGSYSGQWKGVLKCKGMPQTSISGTLGFTLTPAGSPEAFKVKGSMSGTVFGGLPFAGPISGAMGCTALTAGLPDIKVGSGALIYRLKGTLSGTLGSSGFRSGSWTAKGEGCTASGSWRANKL